MKVRVSTYGEPDVGINSHSFTIDLGFKDLNFLAEEHRESEANRILLLIEQCFTEVYGEPCSAAYVIESRDGLDDIFPESTLGRLFTDGNGIRI